jgi:lysophospholipase L1-like esterase
MRVGDSITRFAASDPGLCHDLERAGIRYEMVGSQNSPVPGACGRMEGYNGKTIQFFTRFQEAFGDDGALNHRAVPIELAIGRYRPDLVLLMVGTNNLGGTDDPAIKVDELRGYLDTLLDRLRELAPAAHVIVSTATPANNYYAAWKNMARRNVRTAAYNDEVVKPAVAGRIAAGWRISLADAFAALDPATDLSDGVHPNEAGKAKINAMWFAAIQAWRGARV